MRESPCKSEDFHPRVFESPVWMWRVYDVSESCLGTFGSRHTCVSVERSARTRPLMCWFFLGGAELSLEVPQRGLTRAELWVRRRNAVASAVPGTRPARRIISRRRRSKTFPFGFSENVAPVLDRENQKNLM